MTLASNKEIVGTFFERLNEGRHDEALELLADDAIWIVPASFPGGGEKTKPELREMLRGLATLFVSQAQYRIVSTTAEEDRVSAELRADGELKTGKRYQNSYNMLFVLKNNRIVRVTDYLDTHYAIQVIFGQ